MTHFIPEDGLYVYFRHDERDAVMVVMNASRKERTVAPGRFGEMLMKYRQATDVITGQMVEVNKEFRIRPGSAMILELK
jgi:hypothetical protein